MVKKGRGGGRRQKRVNGEKNDSTSTEIRPIKLTQFLSPFSGSQFHFSLSIFIPIKPFTPFTKGMKIYMAKDLIGG
jgi:hypothetical protein